MRETGRATTENGQQVSGISATRTKAGAAQITARLKENQRYEESSNASRGSERSAVRRQAPSPSRSVTTDLSEADRFEKADREKRRAQEAQKSDRDGVGSDASPAGGKDRKPAAPAGHAADAGGGIESSALQLQNNLEAQLDTLLVTVAKANGMDPRKVKALTRGAEALKSMCNATGAPVSNPAEREPRPNSAAAAAACAAQGAGGGIAGAARGGGRGTGGGNWLGAMMMGLPNVPEVTYHPQFQSREEAQEAIINFKVLIEKAYKRGRSCSLRFHFQNPVSGGLEAAYRLRGFHGARGPQIEAEMLHTHTKRGVWKQPGSDGWWAKTKGHPKQEVLRLHVPKHAGHGKGTEVSVQVDGYNGAEGARPLTAQGIRPSFEAYATQWIMTFGPVSHHDEEAAEADLENWFP